MGQRVRGCGRTNTTLTLYHVAASGNARPVSSGFEHLQCGKGPSTFEIHSYGILLCQECVNRLAFPPYQSDSAQPTHRSRQQG
jgi:hypothetical protein